MTPSIITFILCAVFFFAYRARLNKLWGKLYQDTVQDLSRKMVECFHLELQLADTLKILTDANAKLDYVSKMGLRFGMMSTSDKPEPYLAHTWAEDSDHERMFREWTDSIGWEKEVEKLRDQLAKALADKGEWKDRRKCVNLLQEFAENIEVPERNCACHLNPPCNDCVEFGGMRELLERARAIVASEQGPAVTPV
jgi:superfamily I DNA/RNA helicase